MSIFGYQYRSDHASACSQVTNVNRTGIIVKSNGSNFAFKTFLFLFHLIVFVGAASGRVGSPTNTKMKLHQIASSTNDNKDTIRIVAYDNIRGYLNWLQEWFQMASKSQCSTKCLITDDKSALPTADIVLFHAPTHGKGAVLGQENIPVKKRDRVVHAFVSMEQPKYTRFLADRAYLMRSFDLLLTYSQEQTYPGTNIPNLPLTYYPLNIMPASAILKPAKSLQEKDGYGTGVIAVVFMSNCKKAGADERTKYVQDLMEYLPVHSYGGCLKNRDEPQLPHDPMWPAVAQKRSRKVAILSHYRFYLAFENSAVEDYVSEKIFEGLLAGAVPVYRGAASIAKFMPGGDSFINANGMTPKQLAEHLTLINLNTTMYNSYLAYKNRPVPENFDRIALNSFSHPNVLCRLCEWANSKRHGRQLTDDELQVSNRTYPGLHLIRWSGNV